MPYMKMHHEEDPKQTLLKELGDIDSFQVFNNQLLLAIYVRPKKTKSGIMLTDQTTQEDLYQSKVGLIVKVGPTAFHDESGKWFRGMNLSLHDWVVFRPSESWSINVHGVPCRLIDDIFIRGKVEAPDQVW
jgi:co-chaperonin GroES (HSP10)